MDEPQTATGARRRLSRPEDRYNSHFFERRVSPRRPSRMTSPPSRRPLRQSPLPANNAQTDPTPPPVFPRPAGSPGVPCSRPTVSSFSTPQRARRSVYCDRVSSSRNGSGSIARPPASFIPHASVMCATPPPARSGTRTAPGSAGRTPVSGKHAAAASAWGWESSPRAVTVSSLSPRPSVRSERVDSAKSWRQLPQPSQRLQQQQQQGITQTQRGPEGQSSGTNQRQAAELSASSLSVPALGDVGAIGSKGTTVQPRVNQWSLPERSKRGAKPGVELSSVSDDEDGASPERLAHAGALGRRSETQRKGSQQDEHWFYGCDEKSPSSSHRSDAVTCSTQISEVESQFSGGSALSGASGGVEGSADCGECRY